MQTPKDITASRYLNGDYASKNPDWDSFDAPWKAGKVVELITRHSLKPRSIVEIGCGSGNVLASLRPHFPEASLSGFDIAPDLERYWQKHENINFTLGDYSNNSAEIPDLILLLDVLEHLGDPFNFLEALRTKSKYVALHFPLDLSALSVVRESPLLYVRNKVGHLHYFTKGLALALLEESGFEVIEARYTDASFNAPNRGLKTRLASIFRRLAYCLLRDMGVRLLGGETLMVLARSRSRD